MSEAKKTCGALDPHFGIPCTRTKGHDDPENRGEGWYPAHSHSKDAGAWYVEWVDPR